MIDAVADEEEALKGALRRARQPAESAARNHAAIDETWAECRSLRRDSTGSVELDAPAPR
ncbi:hypothetical protein [Streptomyces formicae]|uniref:Uncharacterized protein n=1 Tax=Streptomyces formicae TaxID=1616117 RepID=A0ABY3WUY6_9ACTN|nr:hypothetical protein [Streptomyces formicae]UNM13598.1 hypothetical protein J4032_20910 [Streptomyces formicae]